MGDDTAVPELLRQREMLERSVATLRAQALKQAAAHKDRVTTLVKVSQRESQEKMMQEDRDWWNSIEEKDRKPS